MDAIIREFLDQSIYRIEKNKGKLSSCMEQLTEEQVWLRPNPASNSIGNLLLHLCGNMRQYIISGIGRQPDHRERDKEFSAANAATAAHLLGLLDTTISEAIEIIRSADREKLLKEYSVQGFDSSGIGIIIHVTEHFSHHTGQVIFWTKQLTSRDLGFYAGIDLNQHNRK